ncbi:hypothetical protein [Mycobacterium intracellulare]|uniref:hypothetical protein n=1 Tax=Mycobacterium intracellulare TaxID=1767 RepID=UPI000BAABA66|nr:hypothetical protein [Mycobacterium intracellulare]ASW84761.1 hypothetical protein CKJ61_07540 [Mycobacterium intracellulare]
MRTPSNLGKHGTKLWKAILAEFDLENEPAKLRILADAAKVADIIAELDEAADEAPLTVKGSMGQPVISPLIAEARVQRSLLASLLAKLNLDPAEGDSHGSW